MTNIGLMGGTFDPIHNAHLSIARAALEFFSLDRVMFIPTGDPPHKSGMTDKHHRLKMAELAVYGQPGFLVSPIEILREGTTYTIDTLCQLRLIMPDSRFYYIVGADTLVDIGSWREVGRVLELCEIIAFHRSSVVAQAVTEKLEWLKRRFSKIPMLLPVSAPDISSTEIRERLRCGKPVSTMIPPTVADYIDKHQLYMQD